MNTPCADSQNEARAEVARDDNRKLMRGFAGFQMATALVVSAKAPEVQMASWVVGLFAVSIPSTVVVGFFPRFTRADEDRNPAAIAFLASVFSVVPSFAALTILLWAAAGSAALLFPAVSLFWVLVIIIIRTRTPKQK